MAAADIAAIDIRDRIAEGPVELNRNAAAHVARRISNSRRYQPTLVSG
jgi:hypothetical protein